MKYKLIAIDFDGTLVNDERKVTERTKEALFKKKEENYKIVGVTARALESAKAIGDISFFDYFILNNGAFIYNVENKKEKYINKIAKEHAQKITEELDEVSTQIDYCSGNCYYLYKNQNKDNPYFIKTVNGLEEVDEEIAKINIYLKEPEKIEYYRDKIRNKFPDISCFIMQDSADTKKWLVLTPKGLNKKSSLQQLGEKLNIKLEEMIFFGDGTNDIEVITAVGCGVAMGNALEEVKKKASHITTSNNEDGIACFLERL